MSARVLAWSTFGLFVAVILAALGLIVIETHNWDDAFFVVVVGFGFVGALVAARQPGNAVGWLLLGAGLVLALGVLLDSYILQNDPPALRYIAWVADWSWYVWLTCAAIFLPLVFPTGHLASPRWRPVLWLGVAALAVSAMSAAFDPGPLDVDARRPIENPFGIAGADGFFSTLAVLGNALAGLAFVLAGASLVVRYRHSQGVERQQLKWFAYVGLLLIIGLTVAMIQVLFGLQEGDPDSGAGPLEVLGAIGWFLALAAVVIGIPAATGMAILRHRLYDIDVVIRRTLVYAGLSATLIAAYLGGVLLLQVALSPLTEESDLAIAGSTLAVAALFRPVRARVQELVDRRFYRSRYDAALTLEGFGARLRNELELDSLSGELRGVVAETMQPAHVSLWLRSP